MYTESVPEPLQLNCMMELTHYNIDYAPNAYVCKYPSEFLICEKEDRKLPPMLLPPIPIPRFPLIPMTSSKVILKRILLRRRDIDQAPETVLARTGNRLEGVVRHSLALLAQLLVMRILLVCVEFDNFGTGKVWGVASLFAE